MTSARLAIRRLRRRSPAASRKARGVRRRARKPAATASGRYGQGFGHGYREGVQAGLQSYPNSFEGTSIIIPTYNQLDLLNLCLNSITENTDLPYEVIVIDNASTDGTGEYLRRMSGQVRFRVLDSNRGFAGAINIGLMMAKGTTILLLNNDTLVTEHWLENMLACLNSDDRIGMVGPITNYISGDQQVDVPYRDVSEMPAFARENNIPNPERWRRTDRLVGFCLLFRRELFRQIGYFDEGFEIGNFEDDDFNIRVRMLGKSLVVAEDAFIHHFGSVSMKALGDRFMLVNDRNQQHFKDKWNNPYEWIHRALRTAGGSVPDMASLFPSLMAVQGIGAPIYWVENGTRRPIEGTPRIPVVRLSQVDVKRWRLAEPIQASEAEARWFRLHGRREDRGGVVRFPDGSVFLLEENRIRSIVSPTAFAAWHLDKLPVLAMKPEELLEKAEGLPIIAPPTLRQAL
ncbi:glycosyltransferase family 2 protein [Cohnella zeiphila]|uniref:Glycosyltransferase family 2 protein n=1 Tax=Cohnella zeiphila TaxID=2761120 RepID=A0A7X0STT1_9BACL|nr:glycosyltransferase family 2 protein [Cohnella zeiphila]MBB6736009.1 glycosyltransferase family 2 protein [Cohnella zeiphila]